MTDAIVVQNLSKRFSRYHANRPTTLKEALLRGLHRLRPVEYFWALQDVSFRVEQGKVLGLIGANGAGKSTLLRLIGGVGRPDSGTVETHGRIRALLSLGAGFHPDLTGRENVFINGVIAGLTRHEIARRFEAIVSFAELEQFIDNPLRTYSNGMQMRLGFAVAVHTDPEILLIDEVLAVGDVKFQRKCFDRISHFKSEGCTILLVSHDTNQVQRLSDEVLWLQESRVIAYGDPQEIVGNYVKVMTQGPQPGRVLSRAGANSANDREQRIHKNRLGSLELEITEVRLRNRQGKPITELNSGDALRVEIEYLASQPIESPIFGTAISCEDRRICCNTNTAAVGLKLPVLHGRGRVTLHLERLDLIGGQYYVNVGVYERSWAYAYDYHWHMYPLLIQPTHGGTLGVMHPPHHWEIEDIPAAEPGRLILNESS